MTKMTKKNVTRSVELVTPDMAREILLKNKGNRVVDAHAVDRLAKVIKSGGWRTTHQGIAIGANDTLYDGQHRLHAIVLADIAVSVEVTRGLSAEVLSAIDSNVGKGPRSASDIVNITHGLNLRRSEVAALTMAANLVGSSNLRVTSDVLVEYEAAHGEALRAIHPILSGATIRVGSAINAGVLMVTWVSNPSDSEAFAKMLRSGEDLDYNHPVLALRNHLFSRIASVRSAIARVDMAQRVFAAFDAYARGDGLRRLKNCTGARDRYVAAWKLAKGID